MLENGGWRSSHGNKKKKKKERKRRSHGANAQFFSENRRPE